MSVNTSQKNIELWKSFAPRKKEIINSIDIGLHSIEIYPQDYFHHFNPEVEFKKWAAVGDYRIDDRPHFEVMGETTRTMIQTSEEES